MSLGKSQKLTRKFSMRQILHSVEKIGTQKLADNYREVRLSTKYTFWLKKSVFRSYLLIDGKIQAPGLPGREILHTVQFRHIPDRIPDNLIGWRETCKKFRGSCHTGGVQHISCLATLNPYGHLWVLTSESCPHKKFSGGRKSLLKMLCSFKSVYAEN